MQSSSPQPSKDLSSASLKIAGKMHLKEAGVAEAGCMSKQLCFCTPWWGSVSHDFDLVALFTKQLFVARMHLKYKSPFGPDSTT